VLRDDPGKAIEYLREEDCEMLVSSTNFDEDYVCMPDVKAWADGNAQESGRSKCYINTGVYIARKEFLRELLTATLEYVTTDDLSREEYKRLRRAGTLCETLAEFPKGVGCDQVIVRSLHPRFYPRLKLDYKERLALR